jgi:hydroxyacylglutathione hydrolase
VLLKYFYQPTLAHASYLVGCQATNEAIIIDPGRDIEPYLNEARAQGMQIVAVTETHIHADFVSGARELADRAGATLYLSDEGDEHWKYLFLDGYKHVLLRDGDTFKIGNIQFEVMHTPGHTPEHICLLVTDRAGADRPMGLFSGDFVFVGDVGRPDLLDALGAANEAGSAETGARQLFHSLKRFKELPDYLQVWPAHGAGSACGKALGAVPSTTVGYEKLFNIALSFADEDTFVKALLDGQPEPPKYFAVMKRVNKEGPPIVHGLPLPERLPFEQLGDLLDRGATVIDTRPVAAYAAAHIPGSINIPYDSSFLTWAGWLLDYSQPFYLIIDPLCLEDAIRNLVYIGLENVAGYFDTSAINAWHEAGHPAQSYEVKTPPEIADLVRSGQITVVDVRNEMEWAEGHIPQAKHIMLGYLPDRVSELPTDKPVLVQCLMGTRSAIGASILQALGISEVMNLAGGMRDWASAGLPIVVD